MRQQADRELSRVEAALVRIEGDYIAGRLSAEKWDRLETRLNAEREAAKAQADQHHRQREAITQEIAQFDAEAAIAQELAALRRHVVGQLRSSDTTDLDALRATLRQTFAGFELCSPAAPFGSGVLQGAVWSANPERDDRENLTGVGEGYRLLPVVRTQAVDISPDANYAEGFPAVTGASLPLHAFLCTRLAA